MNILESHRVLSALDATVDSLRLLSYITLEVVAAADQLGGVLGQDVRDALLQHAAALSELPEDYKPYELQHSSSALLRVLQKSPGIEEALQSLEVDRSPAIQQLISYFDRHRADLHKQLITTVEEDATNRDHFTALADRREKAAALKLQLEHKLKTQRMEQAKQIGVLQAAQDAAAAELAELRSSHAAGQAATESEAAAVKDGDSNTFSADHADLAKQLQEAHNELNSLRSDNSSAAAAARKARKRAQQDCEASISEYDAELGARQKEYEQALTAYKELQDQIGKHIAESDALRAERLAYEEAVRAAAEAKKKDELRLLRIACAVYMIQNTWKVYRKKKAAEAKKAAGKGKGSAKGSAKGKK